MTHTNMAQHTHAIEYEVAGYDGVGRVALRHRASGDKRAAGVVLILFIAEVQADCVGSCGKELVLTFETTLVNS